MHLLLESLKRRLPPSWSIYLSESGTIVVLDPTLEKSRSYIVNVHNAFTSYRAQIEFGIFAADIANHAKKQLLDRYHPVRKIFEVKKNVKLSRFRTTIEDALNPEKVYSDGWWLEFEYKKTEGIAGNESSFSDILLSLLLYILPYDFDVEEEGAPSDLLATEYERSQLNRSLCLAFHGYSCKACGLNLEEKYGNVARSFIHVHHITPISQTKIRKPDPVKDLVPLCPNCHGIAHLRNPPYSVEEIKKMIESNGNLLT